MPASASAKKRHSICGRTRCRACPASSRDIIPDPTANPLDRLQIFVSPESRFTAAGLASALAAGSPPIIVRNHEVERGHFFLDPCNLHPGEAEIVAERLRAVLSAADRPAMR